MFGQTVARMFLLVLLLASGKAIRDEFLYSYDVSQTSLTSKISNPQSPPVYPSCFTEGTTWDTEEAIDVVPDITDVYSCQDLCGQSSACHELTWYDDLSESFFLTCFLYDSTTTEYPCTNCVSGPQSCTCGAQYLCGFTHDNFVGQVSRMETEIQCQDYCFKHLDCRHYNWMDQHSQYPNRCLMFSSCDEKLFTCHTCHSGPADCRNTSVLTSTTMSSKTTTSLSSSTTTTSATSSSTPTTTTTSLPSTTTTSATSSSTPTTTTTSLPSTTTTSATSSSTPTTTTTPLPSTTTASVSTSLRPTTITTTPTPTSTTPTPTTTKPSTTPLPTTISTTTPPHQSCDIPSPQEHGDWLCPPWNNLTKCHLECDPGYVSSNGTIITCQHGEWSSAPRCVAAVALITGNTETPHNTVELYGEGLHVELPNLPDDRERHSVDLVNSFVIVCGGHNTATSCLVLSSSLQWTSHSTTTSSRAYSSVSMLGNLHLLGGSNSPSTTESLAPASGQWHQSWDLLEPTRQACATKIEPEVLVMTGGWDNPSSVVSYNITSGEAERLQDLILGRGDHGCVYVKEPGLGLRGVLVAGGFSGDDISSSEMYDIRTGEWSATGELSTGRSGLRMVVLGGSILAMGGRFRSTVFSSVESFNITSGQWMAAESMLEERVWHAVVGVPPGTMGIGRN